MTDNELDAKLRELPSKQRAVEQRIVEAARRIAPVLKDAGRMHSAAEFDQLFFELDAIKEEMTDFVRSDMTRILDRVIKRGHD